METVTACDVMLLRMGGGGIELRFVKIRFKEQTENWKRKQNPVHLGLPLFSFARNSPSIA